VPHGASVMSPTRRTETLLGTLGVTNGPVVVSADDNGEVIHAVASLKNYLAGIDWLAAELKTPRLGRSTACSSGAMSSPPCS